MRPISSSPIGPSDDRAARGSYASTWGCDELAGGGGALLRSPFLFYVLGVLGNLVIDLFDFPGQVKILRILCVRLE